MQIEKIKPIFSSIYFKSFLLILFLYILLPVFLPSASYLCETDKININSCLDASWVMGLHWAIQKNLIFGKDYVFTYGPLGFLATRTALGFSYRYLLLSDLFVIGNFAFILAYVFRRFYGLQTVLFCCLVVYSISGFVTYTDQIVFTFLLISVFWLNYSLEYSKPAGLIVPVIVTALLFYIKVNISFVGLIIFYFYLIYFIFSEKEKIIAKILYGLAVPLLIILLSFPLRTDLAGYIAGGFALVDGYNDAMNLKAAEYLKYTIVAGVLIGVFFATFFYKNFKINFVLFVVCGIFTYVLFKQSFVRSDLHVAIFFVFFPGLCALAVIFYKKLSVLQGYAAASICLACLIAGLSLESYPKFGDRLNYLNAVFFGNNIQERYENGFNRFDLPPEVKEIIGAKTVDIIPWNIDYLYFNRLNYDPRPVVQSYSAYTPYLINLNKQKYESDSAPDFVLFSSASLDDRYPFFDDQQIKLELLKNYACLGIYNSQNAEFLLFEKNPGSASLDLSPPVEESIKFGENYLLKNPNKSYFVKININYSVFGKAVRFLYKPFPVLINFTLEDGTARSYRAIVPIMENGVLINPLIENERDFLNFVGGAAVAEGKKIRSFRIELDSPRSSIAAVASQTYRPDIKLSVSEVSIKRNN